ncbi:MAG: 2-oxo acid dehydrogenase subunit E2 [Chlamydiae bacterium]|nr:2-oxo acid dehydrogenase subunit E2 [Chlamydiota bacterium]
MEKVCLPKLGESIMNATVVQWLKKPGEFVEKDEPLLEVMTDKVNSEIPSPCSGILHEISAKVDQEVEVGEVLCLIGQKEAAIKPAWTQPIEETETKTFLSPAVATLAKENKITLEELARIAPTGENGRLCKKDLQKHLENRPKGLSALRKAIAKEMTLSQNIPTATLIDEVDVTDLMAWIQQEKEEFYLEEKAKLTITTCMIKASADVLKELSMLNASLEDDQLIMHQEVHVGMAVSVDQGVKVPVISSCDHKSLAEIARDVSLISLEVRENRWKGDSVKGTFTISNFGMGKVAAGIPMIVPGQAGILGIGAIQKKVLVDENDRFYVGQTLFLSLTFDHRLVDGMYACQFFQLLKEKLSSFATAKRKSSVCR